jgi:hypothetical protein
VKFWSKTKDEEICLILPSSLGLQKERLLVQGVRKLVKKIIWKTAMCVLKNNPCRGFEPINIKQLIFLLRFVSNGRKKKS